MCSPTEVYEDLGPQRRIQALTRMYNQPTKVVNGRHIGLLYKNPIDCLWKTLKTEGPFGWYKGMLSRRLRYRFKAHNASTGSTAHFLRIAPHTYVFRSSILALEQNAHSMCLAV